MKTFVLAAIATAASFTVNAQQESFTQLLTSYYNIKDALVEADSKKAASNATAFITLADAINGDSLTEPGRKIFQSIVIKLQKDAEQIAGGKNTETQRKHFQALSDNMFLLAESIKLSDQPIYQQYCPMKKAYWLSNEQIIQNPYYGKQMLNCGKVTKTIK
ncbi:MAG: DUF3347 domain-containing protein [Chitinophagaceae bacterium]|nr:DUF3347 domain-containing protein [Chitinophagaceae bacterium]